MHSRRDFLAWTGAALLAPSGFAISRSERLVSKEDLSFLRALAAATIASATKNESQAKLGFPVVTPGGAYPAFWIRDFSMAAGCGLLSPSSIKDHLKLIAASQNGGRPRVLGKRALVPSHAVPDHVNYDGGAVFYPGTYSSGDDQGGEPWGVLPPVDDHFEFVHIAHVLWKKTKSADFLDEPFGGHTLFERLALALDCPATDPRTGLVKTEVETRAVGFGFCDGVYFTGSLLYASLLRYRALGEIVELAGALDRATRVKEWRAQRNLIKDNLSQTFAHKGWLKAATGVGQQPDVWGTIYALYLGAVAEPRELLTTLTQAVREGKVTYKGAVRHVPTDHDFSKESAWEKTAGEALNTYQNGAYWHVPSGYLTQVLRKSDKKLARELVSDMVNHFRQEDFRLGEGHGAPWECIHPSGGYRQNPVYMASVTLPLEALTR